MQKILNMQLLSTIYVVHRNVQGAQGNGEHDFNRHNFLINNNGRVPDLWNGDPYLNDRMT